jgi:hypothetical protein
MATRNSSKASFDHILDVVLARSDGSSLKKSLIQHGYTDIHGLMMLNDDVISSLSYDEPERGLDVPLLKFEKALISTFLDFVIHRNSGNNPIRNDWTRITKEEFEDFMIDPNYLVRRRNLPNTFSLNFPSTGSTPWPALRGPRSIAEFFNDEFGDDSLFSTQASVKQGHTRCIANILDDHRLSTAVSVGTLERCPTPTHNGEEASEGTNGDRYEVRIVKQQSILHRPLVVQFPLLTNLMILTSILAQDITEATMMSTYHHTKDVRVPYFKKISSRAPAPSRLSVGKW